MEKGEFPPTAGSAALPQIQEVMRIGFIAAPGRPPELVVATPIQDLYQALGILEAAKDFLKAESAKQAAGPRIEVARGNVPRTKGG